MSRGFNQHRGGLRPEKTQDTNRVDKKGIPLRQGAILFLPRFPTSAVHDFPSLLLVLAGYDDVHVFMLTRNEPDDYAIIEKTSVGREK